MGRELVELAHGDLDGDGVIGRVERAAVCVAARSVGQRAVGVADGCAVGERGRGRVVRVGLHEELVAAIADGEAVVASRTQARAGRVGREVHAPVRRGRDDREVRHLHRRDDDGFARRARLARVAHGEYVERVVCGRADEEGVGHVVAEVCDLRARLPADARGERQRPRLRGRSRAGVGHRGLSVAGDFRR